MPRARCGRPSEAGRRRARRRPPWESEPLAGVPDDLAAPPHRRHVLHPDVLRTMAAGASAALKSRPPARSKPVDDRGDGPLGDRAREGVVEQLAHLERRVEPLYRVALRLRARPGGIRRVRLQHLRLPRGRAQTQPVRRRARHRAPAQVTRPPASTFNGTVRGTGASPARLRLDDHRADTRPQRARAGRSRVGTLQRGGRCREMRCQRAREPLHGERVRRGGRWGTCGAGAASRGHRRRCASPRGRETCCGGKSTATCHRVIPGGLHQPQEGSCFFSPLARPG